MPNEQQRQTSPRCSRDECRRLEDRLRQAQKMEAVGRLAEGVAHDFNNLLTAINGYSELALLQIAEDHPLHAGLTEIRKAGQRAAELTRRLLTLSRSRSAAPRKLDLNRIVADMEKLLRRVIGEDIELTTRLAPDLRAIYADPSEVEQILLTLALNAGDAMPGGGRLALETANEPPGSATDGSPRIPESSVQLVVRDTGEGRGEEGRDTDLGIVSGILQQRGGHVERESAVGSGSVLRLFFPSTESVAPATDGDSPPGLPRGDETVLLVEDDAAVRDLVQNILKLQGYRVLEARDAKSAIELCDGLDGRLDLLLTDVVMPGTSGPSLAEDLQRRYRDLKVLFMSGYADSTTGVRLVNQKRASFLPKPFSPEILAHKVRAVLDRPDDQSLGR